MTGLCFVAVHIIVTLHADAIMPHLLAAGRPLPPSMMMGWCFVAVNIVLGLPLFYGSLGARLAGGVPELLAAVVAWLVSAYASYLSSRKRTGVSPHEEEEDEGAQGPPR